MRDDVFQPNQLDASPSATECVWMGAGIVGYKLCDREFDCEHCPFDLAIRDGGHLAMERAQVSIAAGKHPPPASTLLERADVSHLDACDLAAAVFYHPGHVWARIEDEGRVRIGMDDFGQHLVGRIYAVELPAVGSESITGTPCWRISHPSGDTLLVAPVPGIIQQINPKLAERPSLINRDPYGEGWAFMVQPTHLEQSLKPLYYGERAARWFDESIARLKEEVNDLLAASSPGVGTTMTDGGRAVEDIHLLLDPNQLQKLIDSFLSTPADCQVAKDAGQGR